MPIETPMSTDTVEVEKAPIYDGMGTDEDPFVVQFQKNDPDNPMNWSSSRKWFIACIATTSVFAITLASSAYSASSNEILAEFDVSPEVFTLGLSLFVLGFAVGPGLWGPLSELYGRRKLWITSHIAMVFFLGGSAGSQNIATLLVLRFFAGTFGASPLVNSGGTIADLFLPAQRGLALTVYSVAPFLGPVLGPVVGGFISENIGWRWVQGVCTIFIGLLGILGGICIPETYGPVILQRHALSLSRSDFNTYISVLEKRQGKKNPSEVFKKALFRPWIFLFLEPILLVASIYMAIIYGTVYMFMSAMPIVFNEDRGWSEGIGGLSFLGIAMGIVLGLVYTIWDNNTRYIRLVISKTTTPESRLPPAIIGAVALPIGMFAFAWTNYPSIHWSVCIILSAPFGFGCVLVLLPIMNYLIDTYTIYASSVLAAAAIFRSVVGAVFPLFTTQMYNNLGIHWASSVPAFMTVICMPFPLIMYCYGMQVRMKCKFSFEAAEIMRTMQMQHAQSNSDSRE
ncbi:Major facilitator superfamily domain general substrate transporter [Penicillium malachiteum]|uniref:Major facilitator superfamily domain general substrate transporter n=1 Tax=Penicillium malachiteum TaxID=1324776 RepID=UPI00254822D7|nr:Major facilitator superfamily domain general substrate transporter [Penicillium malachiteum]KAJ5731795.1 Major facilitator superfamily domain general substrate transporter [Penicillium malachiteum]